MASWFSLSLLNRPDYVLDSKRFIESTEDDHELLVETDQVGKRQLLQRQHESIAGKTLDLSITVLVRALETVLRTYWSSCSKPRPIDGRLKFRTEALISRLADTGVFAVSSATVMWAYFYMPQRLSRSYNRWIGTAAQIDPRLVAVLRLARRGEFIYGHNTGQARILQGMCHDFGWPMEYGP